MFFPHPPFLSSPYRPMSVQPVPPPERAPKDLRFSKGALCAFAVVTFGIVGMVGKALHVFGIGTDDPAYVMLYAIGLVSPCLGAIAYSLVATGSLKPILSLYRVRRLGPGAWMILIVPLSVASSYLFLTALGLPLDSSRLPSVGTFLLAALGWSSVMWAEETGWRGVLLPVLQRRLGPLVATLYVASAWALWHVPLLVVLGMPTDAYLWFALHTLGMSFAMTWAWNRSGSVVVAILIHGANNATMMAFVEAVPGWSPADLMAVQASGIVILGMAVLVVTCGRLGFASTGVERDGPESISCPLPQKA